MVNLSNFFNNFTKNPKKADESSNNTDPQPEKFDDNPDDAPNFIKKDEQSSEQKSEQIKDKLNAGDAHKLDEIIESFRKTQVRPLSNQQRNLDREEGGVEHEIHETETHVIDEWDGRALEVVEMGKHNPINKSSGKKSMIWNLKRKRLQQKKIEDELKNVKDDLKDLKTQDQQGGDEFDSRKKQSLTQRIQALRQDRTDFKPPSHIR